MHRRFLASRRFAFHRGLDIGSDNGRRFFMSMTPYHFLVRTVCTKNQSIVDGVLPATKRRTRFQESGKGFTLVELIVAIGLFSLVMLLASSSYLLMIGINRQAQGITTGINNLSFALSTMTRDIRTGTAYNCADSGDCVLGGDSFTFIDEDGDTVTYARGTQQGPNGQVGDITKNDEIITDPGVDITSLIFYAFGATPGDDNQPRVIIIVSGEVPYAAGKTETFTVETGATMRGSDL